MAGEIERSSEPKTRSNIELAATSVANFRDCPLEGLSVQGDAIGYSSEIGEVECRMSELRKRPVVVVQMVVIV